MPDGPTGPPKVLQTLRRLPRQFLIGLVRVYQVVLSPHQPATCRFSPTCSAYAVEALRKYGAVKGTILAVHRVLRCNPWGGHGYDPPRWYGEPAPDETAGPSRHDHHRGVSHGL